jgi:DNA uptake protein ComE-like DNA-binding protein
MAIRAAAGLCGGGLLYFGVGALAPRAAPSVAVAAPCERAVERQWRGVECDGSPGAHAGDRIDPAGRVVGRMAPAAIGALGVAVDLNRASVAELEALEGVGPKLAARIIETRPFGSVVELARVRGVGPRLAERLREHVRVAP